MHAYFQVSLLRGPGGRFGGHTCVRRLIRVLYIVPRLRAIELDATQRPLMSLVLKTVSVRSAAFAYNCYCRARAGLVAALCYCRSDTDKALVCEHIVSTT